MQRHHEVLKYEEGDDPVFMSGSIAIANPQAAHQLINNFRALERPGSNEYEVLYTIRRRRPIADAATAAAADEQSNNSQVDAPQTRVTGLPRGPKTSAQEVGATVGPAQQLGAILGPDQPPRAPRVPFTGGCASVNTAAWGTGPKMAVFRSMEPRDVAVPHVARNPSGNTRIHYYKNEAGDYVQVDREHEKGFQSICNTLELQKRNPENEIMYTAHTLPRRLIRRRIGELTTAAQFKRNQLLEAAELAALKESAAQESGQQTQSQTRPRPQPQPPAQSQPNQSDSVGTGTNNGGNRGGSRRGHGRGGNNGRNQEGYGRRGNRRDDNQGRRTDGHGNHTGGRGNRTGSSTNNAVGQSSFLTADQELAGREHAERQRADLEKLDQDMDDYWVKAEPEN